MQHQTSTTTEFFQLWRAAILGSLACVHGLPCSPADDTNLMAMLRGRLVGLTPTGEASTLQMFSAYAESYFLTMEAQS
jgi:hypothetical protein